MKSQDPKNHQSPQEVGGLPKQKKIIIPIECKYEVLYKSAKRLIDSLEAEIDHFKATKDNDKEIMDLLNAALDNLDDYIGLANVVESFIAITEEHPLYDGIRKDIICYLKNIKKKK